MYKSAKSATDRDGRKIHVGDLIVYVGSSDCPVAYECLPVEVVDIWKQGADGTIVKTKPAPDPEYPHHFSCRANLTKKLD